MSRPKLSEQRARAILREYPDADLSAFDIESDKDEDTLAVEEGEKSLEAIRRRGHACDVCGHFACVCQIRHEHDEDCMFRRAATFPVGLACGPHGRDTCPECDPCTCNEKRDAQNS